ncbi:MAG: efflux RND transporter periplasmic adaptor subunit [Acidobacteriota bacterium]
MAERLKRFIAIIKKRRTPIGIIVLLAAVVGVAAFIWGDKASASDYITARVERGNVEVNVAATGTVQAVTTVQVGSQVSGTVQWLGADFNSQVQRGQVIARLDPAIFQAQVENSRANVTNAQAAVQAAETEIVNQRANLQAIKANLEVTRVQREDALALVKRYQDLKNVLSGRDLEAAQAQANAAAARYEQAAAQVAQVQSAGATAKARLDQAKASVSQAQAQLQQSQLNLDHSIIASPIDGVVVSRNVDVGQTVAASLSAPTLFTIANDLTKMQVLASIDEADVGQIRQGIRANFSVDAYPGETFSGEISQLRLNAQTLQNVVTYSAVIDVANTAMKLRPGMTANITIMVAKREGVLTVANAALRFKPNLSEKEQEAFRLKMDERRKELETEQQAQGGQDGQQGNPEGNQGAGQRTGGQGRQGSSGGGEGARRRGEGGQGNREGWRQRGEGGQGNREGWRQRGEGGQGNREGRSQRQGGEAGQGNREGRRQRQEGEAGQGNREGRSQRQEGEAGQRGGGGQAADAQGQRSRGEGTQPGPRGESQRQGREGGQGAQSFGGAVGGGQRRQWQTIWVLTADKSIEPRLVRTGLTNGRVTEIVAGDLQEGDTVIIGQNEAGNANRQQPAATPFGQRPPGGPGGGRGPGR